MSNREALEFIINRILAGDSNLDHLKREACTVFGISMVKNPQILKAFPKDRITPEILKILLKKPTKTLSGVTPVAVMIKPQDSCKWGCVFCPFTGLAAKSYTGFEPAALRGRQFAFDPYLQASSRVKQFEGGGHPADKCEVIVMGGTFLEMDKEYKTSFIKGIYDGLNGFRSSSLEDSISANQTAKTHRVIGLTIETRPDVCPIDEILSYGATRVELGVQHADDELYKIMNRGHKVSDVIRSTKMLKDAAFKVLYHIMPGLPGSNQKKDIEFANRLFADENFRPDMMKIYPTLVIGGTVLHKMMEKGEYRPYSTEDAAEVISEFYRYIPKYVRVMRIQRDIPANKIDGGVKKSNLRELVEAKIREKGIIPREIRYREVGLQKKKLSPSKFRLERFDYNASNGKETFLSYENDDDLIAGFIRLRFPPSDITGARPEMTPETALIRELHIYGSQVPLEGSGEIQHRGLGVSLLKETEQIAKDNGKEKMIIISGVGVRAYYQKHGYYLEGPYMAKKL